MWINLRKYFQFGSTLKVIFKTTVPPLFTFGWKVEHQWFRTLKIKLKILSEIYPPLQLNKWQTDPYFFQNFQCNTMLIHAFCKTSDQKIVFVLTFVVFSRLYSIGNFVIQLHTCLQRGFDSILQYLNFTFLSHFLFWFVEQLYGRNSDKTRK